MNYSNGFNNEDNSTDGDSGSQYYVPGTPDWIHEGMPDSTTNIGSSRQGENFLRSLIRPHSVPEFMEHYWQRRPLHVHVPECSKFFSYLASHELINKMLLENYVDYSKNIDLQFKDGDINEPSALIGRALPQNFWQYHKVGCGIRVLNPVEILPTIYGLNATLQEYFQCAIESHLYLGSRYSPKSGPRCDDVETFVLQIEGSRRWRIYEPLTRKHMLPRESKNVDEKEFGKFIFDIVLKAGETLYFPRGFIYQHEPADTDSVHLTLGVYRKQTYFDLLKILMPIALEEYIKENENLSKSVPLDIYQNLGFVHNDKSSPERDAIVGELMQHFETVYNRIMDNIGVIVNNAVDRMAVRYQRVALPPSLSPREESLSIFCQKATMCEDTSSQYFHISLYTNIRLIRENVARMVRLGKYVYRLYYSSSNTKEYKELDDVDLSEHDEIDENYLELDSSEALAFQLLKDYYPNFLTPKHLRGEDHQNCIVAQKFWDKGILMTDKPLV